jgi:deoxyribonuclease V
MPSLSTMPRLAIPDMSAALRQLLAQVPAGRVTTYGALADALGNKIAARWVGHFLMHHEHAATCPCHRVVRVDGQLGGYVAGTAAKARKLAEEGIDVGAEAVRRISNPSYVVDLARYGFAGFVGDRPLAKLSRLQQRLFRRVSLRGPRRVPRQIAGVDVSYASPTEAVAAFALVDAEMGSLAWSHVIRRPVRFPYITSYLSFRELPILLDLLDEVRAADRLARVVLVDGSGMLHPRRAGIATHLGVLADLSTIGLTKKLLCGNVDLSGMGPLESRPVIHEDRVLGTAIRSTAGSRRPIFVSVGHRIGLGMAETVVRRMLLGKRLPEPLYWADRLSRAAARR